MAGNGTVEFVSVARLRAIRDIHPPLLWDQVWSLRLVTTEPREPRGEMEMLVLKERVRDFTDEGCTQDV